MGNTAGQYDQFAYFIWKTAEHNDRQKCNFSNKNAKRDPVSGREVGTLYHLRQLFHMTNVYASVKKNYKSAENLMLSATKAYICCSFMMFAGLESLEDTPSKIQLPPDDADNDLKAEFFKDTIRQFVDKYVMVSLLMKNCGKQNRNRDLKQRKSSIDMLSSFFLYQNVYLIQYI